MYAKMVGIMSLARAHSVSLLGLEAISVDVEVDAFHSGSDKNSIIIVGLPDTAVRESRDRVLSAMRNSGYPLSPFNCTINLAPGDLRKEGALYDLPIALGILQSLGKIPSSVLTQEYLIVGEMGLSGELRPVNGALAIALHARELKMKGVLLPAVNAPEAAAVNQVDIIPITNLKEAIAFFQNPSSIKPHNTQQSQHFFKSAPPLIDFADIKGHINVKRAMEIAAAGGHNVVMSGPPGSGKTMMAKAMVGIMPELTIDEALETTRIHSIAGLLRDGQSLLTQRPFRSPHHTISYAGLIGGGTNPRPGEVSLAHQGILFLDELPEFSRMVLEVLRQPLEDRKVTISRANGSFTFPTNFICIAAMNPCPCGYLGHPDKPCKDSQLQVNRYRGKISGPLWDRMDMHIEVPALRYQDMMDSEVGEYSHQIRERVILARQKQYARFGKVKTNAMMSSREVKNYVPLNQTCQNILRHAIDVTGISARASDRLLRVALTISDLNESNSVTEEHLLEAISFRNLVEQSI